MPHDSDLLFAYARRGDVKSLSALVIRHAKWLMAYLRGMCPSETDAEDVFQECWARVIKSAASYRGGSVRSYLLCIARSVIVDRFRRRGAVTVSIDGEETADLTDALADERPTPAELHEIRATSADIRRAVLALPDGQRDVLLMRIEGELSFKEIAEQLRIPLGTALTWMHVATVRLRKMLGGVS